MARLLWALLLTAPLGAASRPGAELQPSAACPEDSWCLPAGLCQPADVLSDAGNPTDYLCSVTEDSELSVCCGRPSLTSVTAAAAAVSATAPSSAATQTAAPLPLNHLAEVFSTFFDLPPPHVPMPLPSASPDAVRAPAEQKHHPSDVLLWERQQSDRSETPARGSVIYPAQIAARRRREARSVSAAAGRSKGDGNAAEGVDFRSTFERRLKPAGSLGAVKLGGLTPPPRGSSSQPDTSPEFPVLSALTPPMPQPPLPPPHPQQQTSPDFGSPRESMASETHEEALPEAIAVAPRTEPQLEISVDVRPLAAEMWRGVVPQTPAGRNVAVEPDSEDTGEDDDSSFERPSGSILRKILESLPGGPASRHGHQQGQGGTRGQFFEAQPPLPLHRPPQPPRPPFHQPPPHLQLQHFRPGQQDFTHPIPGPQAGSHFDPVHHSGTPQHAQSPDQSVFQLGLPPHERPSQQGPLHQENVHQRPTHHESPSPQATHPLTTSLHFSQSPVAPLCGRGAASGLHARITVQRGEDGVTEYGEYPWHVGVLAADLTYLCAGVLVAPRLALTVAHCLSPLPTGTPLLLRVGDWDLASEDEFHPAYDVEVVRAVIHPEFYAGNLQNDIALLLLDPPVDGLPHVQPACLPPPHAEFAHQQCWVSGWGQALHVAGDVHEPSSYSWVLREAPVAVVPADSCQRRLRATQLGPFYQLARRTGLPAAPARSRRAAVRGRAGLVGDRLRTGHPRRLHQGLRLPQLDSLCSGGSGGQRPVSVRSGARPGLGPGRTAAVRPGWLEAEQP